MLGREARAVRRLEQANLRDDGALVEGHVRRRRVEAKWRRAVLSFCFCVEDLAPNAPFRRQIRSLIRGGWVECVGGLEPL
jgi:hypothetical protein